MVTDLFHILFVSVAMSRFEILHYSFAKCHLWDHWIRDASAFLVSFLPTAGESIIILKLKV